MTERGGALRALAELRFRLVLRRLRGRGGVPELVSRIALWAVILPAGIVFGGLAGSGAFQVVRAGGASAHAGARFLLLGVWLAWTMVGLSLADRDLLDLRRFLVYPLPPGRVFAYGLVTSVLGDPFALFWSLLLLGAFAGAAVARPGAWLLLLAAALALYVAGVVALLALLQELLARAFAGRRARVAALAAVYIGLGFTLAWVGGGGGRRVVAVAHVLVDARWAAYPAALAAEAVAHLYAGAPARAVPWLLGLTATTALTGWAAFRLALAGALAGGEPTACGGGAGEAGWRLPGRLAPLLEKEVKYLLRHPLAGVLALVLPGVAGFVGWSVVPILPAEGGELVRGVPLLGFAVYVHLATQAFWLNTLGWDRGGVRTWFLAPVPLGDVLRAKNDALLLLSGALFVASAAAMIAASGRPASWALVGAAVLHLGIAPWFLTAGNLVSVLNPRPGVYTVQRGGRLPATSMVAGMLIVSTGGALFAIPALLAVHLEAPWVLVGAWVVLGLTGAALHRATLGPLGRLLDRRRELVMAAVVGDDT